MAKKSGARRGTPQRQLTSESWRPVGGIQDDTESMGRLGREYGFSGEDLFRMFDTARNHTIRDRRSASTNSGEVVDRTDAKAAAIKIVKQSKALLKGIDQLRDSIKDFEDDFEYSPVLMEAIFEVDAGLPDRLHLPDDLQVLPAAFHDPEPWKRVRVLLSAVAGLPIRPKKSGPNYDVGLQRCVDECRKYWEGRGLIWRRDALEEREYRDTNDPAALTGDCERFVCDVLRMVGTPHTLDSLAKAMG